MAWSDPGTRRAWRYHDPRGPGRPILPAPATSNVQGNRPSSYSPRVEGYSRWSATTPKGRVTARIKTTASATRYGDAASARAERWWQPRPGRKQLMQRRQLVHPPLGRRRQVRLHHREVGQPLQGPPAPTRGALLHLHRPDVPLALIIGEADRKVSRKPQDHRLMAAEPAGQPQPVL